MSVAEQAVETTPDYRAPTTAFSGVEVTRRWQVYFACVTLALACNYVLGKDMAWDTLNYHLYAGFSALNNRFGKDYFAAGGVGYLNPYAYVPFYAMVRAGLPALVICSIFAAAHSVILWLTFELGKGVSSSQDGRRGVFSGICAVALAFMNPILMQQIGSCFADITTAELGLGGWLLLASAVRLPRVSRVIYAGLILGVASALKLSNALSAISAMVMLAMLPLDWRGKIRHGFLYGVSLCIGFAIIAAPWAYRLQKEFGNPMFPMFNSIFHSPDTSTNPTQADHRFVPESIGAALVRPFAMIDPVRMVHEELSAPDLRYAVLLTLIILFLLRWSWKRFARASPRAANTKPDEPTRVLAALSCGLAVNWILWLDVSGNGRYVLTMSCVAAAMIVGILFRLFQPKVRNYILAIIFVVQAVQLYLGAEYRWNGVPWGGQWFDVSVPDKLEAKSNLYLTVGAQSNSFLVPFLGTSAAFINVAGAYMLDPQGANGARVKESIRRFAPNVRVVFVTDDPSEKGRPEPLLSSALVWYGLRPDLNDCATITVHGLPPALRIRLQGTIPLQPQNRETSFVKACRAVPDTTDLSALIADQRAADVVFDRLEDACPMLFWPRHLKTGHVGESWQRGYGGTDIVASISRGRVKFSDQMRSHEPIDVGSASDWARAPLRLECGKRDGVYFAHVMAASE